MEKIKLEPGDGENFQAERDRQKKDNHNKSEKEFLTKIFQLSKIFFQSRDAVDSTLMTE